MHPKAESIMIPGPEGHLEGRILDKGTGRWALICHPHPQFGGSMNNKVVTTVERALQQKGWSTLAFNFRGVGLSEGAFAQGVGEQADLLAVVTWLRKRQNVERLLLGGFSFGAYISLRVWPQVGPDALLSIAPPVGLWDFSAVETPELPWTVIQGGADEVVDPQAVWSWLGSLPVRPTLYWRAGVSHFFHHQLIWLREIIKLEY